MIPKDLIEFVRDNRPEVLPGKLLVTIAGYNTWLLRYRDESYERYISPDEAAALLVNWLIDKLRDYNINMQWAGGTWYVTFEDDEGFTVLEKTTSLIPLPALWQAYKAAKGIKKVKGIKE